MQVAVCSDIDVARNKSALMDRVRNSKVVQVKVDTGQLHHCHHCANTVHAGAWHALRNATLPVFVIVADDRQLVPLLGQNGGEHQYDSPWNDDPSEQTN